MCDWIRPINLHLTALEQMGAAITIEHGNVHARVDGRLRGARIYFDVSTVTGTENIMMAACLAEGVTVIENAAREPEIGDLAQFLMRRGARIDGAGTDVITIEGVPSLHGADHEIIPDRIETATYLVAGAITRGDVTVERCRPDHSEAFLAKLREAGADLVIGKETIRVRAPKRLRAVDIKTLPYPGFPTDGQAQLMALMAVANGSSMITETVFESRFMHVLELQRMGAEIRIDGKHAVVAGVERLSGAPVMASDLRASACLILAGLAAEGETRVGRVYHLDGDTSNWIRNWRAWVRGSAGHRSENEGDWPQSDNCSLQGKIARTRDGTALAHWPALQQNRERQPTAGL